ncbi:MAG: hypothetical protein A2082_05545 [Chloroflexi bacterium GWC2_70_10]|nr:MAG: hypothetical protein A2082_05545 [Chloroflexi bacterium GWC2_70_10]
MVHIDILSAVIGSRVRADVLAVLHSDPTKVWTAMQIAAAMRRRTYVVERELRRLRASGLIRAVPADHKRLYSAEPLDPVARDLARFVRQTRGAVPAIRKALGALRSPVLAWLTSSTAALMDAPAPSARSALITLTSAPRSLVKIQLEGALEPQTKVHCMSLREWITRLDKGDLTLRRLRRGRKQWIIGSWGELVERERSQLQSTRTLRIALQDWREELSDEWDEDWDPVAGSSGMST